MTRTSNPFTPGFEIMLYVVAGRDDILDDMRETFAEVTAPSSMACNDSRTSEMSNLRALAPRS